MCVCVWGGGVFKKQSSIILPKLIVTLTFAVLLLLSLMVLIHAFQLNY
jgi:hypothetical protein